MKFFARILCYNIWSDTLLFQFKDAGNTRAVYEHKYLVRVIIRKVIESTCGDAESLYSKITDNMNVALLLNNKPFRGRMEDLFSCAVTVLQELFEPFEYARKWHKNSINKVYITGNTAYMFKLNENDMDIMYWTASQEDREIADDNSKDIEEALNKLCPILDKP